MKERIPYMLIGSGFGQKAETPREPSFFFPSKKAQVQVVGTFHMYYPNLDVVKISDVQKIDVLEAPKKTELTEVIHYIKTFKPTKIAIEAFPSWNATEKLRKYKENAYRNERDERFQIAMRLATELGLDTLYSIDAESFDPEIEKLDSIFYQRLIKDFDFESNDPYQKMYMDFYDYSNTVVTKMNMLDYFKYINSKEFHKVEYGGYLVGDFKLDNFRGADILSIWWYNRNLRIYRNLQEISTSTNDKILVLFGNGHASILRQLIESSSEFEFIKFNNLD
ncbi:DUF5694 domain-containing protein [Maribacter sp. 4G9]|uniref:DUF5694 domain-containing protein n=1 Tax=Maribacter sp. 4G9 TaxID=1889777 RepID=UPI000C384E24|nr:DUF5694 domain-containing protein [Maribacter sp. 4G9]PIB37788.1 hypothetical protein BFP75_19885 [Maribacter sp. 4G9]